MTTKIRIIFHVFLIFMILVLQSSIFAQTIVFTDSSIQVFQNPEHNNQSPYTSNSAQAKLIVWSNGSAEVFKKAKINVQGKSITHIYRPQYSIDGITWYYYYYADVYTESERLGDKRGLPGAFLAGSLLDDPLYLCKFDGQQMHSKNCLGFVTDKGVASESRC